MVSENQECLEIKKDDKFFTRIMSKETSMANSSCRVYYGGASSAIPFTWETRPGTPKHSSFHNNNNDSNINFPPLTPPPSYNLSSKSKSMNKKNKNNYYVFNNIFPRFTTKKNSNASSPSSSLSSTTTSTSSNSFSRSSSRSSFHSSPCVFKNSKVRKNPCFVYSKSDPIHFEVDNDNDNDNDDDYYEENGIIEMFPNSPRFLCYGGKINKGFGGCYVMENMKNAFLSIVGGHRNGSSKANY